MTEPPVPADAGLVVPGSIGAHALAWIASLRASGRAVTTVRSRTRELRELFAVIPAHTPARAVTAAHLTAWLIHMRETPGPGGRVRAPNSALQVEDAARMFRNWMVRQELLDANPFRRITRGRPQEVVIHPPGLAEVQTLVEAAGQRRRTPAWLRLRDTALVAVLFDTGLRRAEALTLTVGQVRGGAAGTGLTVLGKGGHRRVVRLSLPVRAAVLAYLAAYEAARRPLADDAALWQGKYGAAMTASSLYDAVRQAGRRSGQYARPHLLRHAFATEFIEATNDVVSAAALLGHRGADLRMTRRYAATVERRRALRQHEQHSPALALRLSARAEWRDHARLRLG